MIRVVIVDDEAPARERLQRLLGAMEDVEVVGEAADGNAALELVAGLQPDLLLLDIRMPGMDGMETARQLTTLPRPPHVVFTTAYGEHALEAFEAEAIDYLVKPVRKERLSQALQRIERLLSTTPVREPGPAHLTVKKHGNIELLPIDEILYFQADNKYVTAYLEEREELLEESLKQLEEQLGERVVRIHRNALVARQALIGMERDQSSGAHYATLKGIGRGPEISRRLVAEVRRLLEGRG